MIKETDASKNDERRVKNKLKPLTHKKKGKTHTMGNQGMKNWKLGTFFVISLMLTIGLFAGVAFAHDPDGEPEQDMPTSNPLTDISPISEISISPSSVISKGMVNLEITYTVTDEDLAVYLVDADGSDGSPETLVGNNRDDETGGAKFGKIRIELPTRWGPDTLYSSLIAATNAYNAAIADAGTDAVVLAAVDANDYLSYLSIKGSANARHRAVVVEVRDPTDDTITIPADTNALLQVDSDADTVLDEFSTGLIPPILEIGGSKTAGWRIDIDVDNMRVGHYVVLTVHKLEVEDIGQLLGTEATLRYPITVSTERYDSRSDRNSADNTTATLRHVPVSQPMIEVGYPAIGRVTIKPKGGKSTDPVSAGSMVNLEVKYQATTTLAMADTDFDDTLTGDDSTFGRIQIQLPVGWGPDHTATPAKTIHLERQSGGVTYLSRASRGVEFATEDSADPRDTDGNPMFSVTPPADSDDGWMIDVDVTDMRNGDHFTITINNLKVGELMATRMSRAMDIDDDELAKEKYKQVKVYSGSYGSKGRDNPTMPPKSFEPDDVTAAKGGSDVQPTITVNRKSQGELTVAPEKVTAGAAEKNFGITYKVTEIMAEDDVIEIELPAGWPVPDVPGAADNVKTFKHDTNPYVNLGGNVSGLDEAVIKVLTVSDDPVLDGPVIQIKLANEAKVKGRTVIINYNNVTVPRGLAKGDEKLSVMAFSGPLLLTGSLRLPQFPVAEHKTIEVIEAADGSGKLVFTFGDPVIAFDDDKVKANTDASIPAGTEEADTLDLLVTYKPAGDMGVGSSEFKMRLPSGWDAAAVDSSEGSVDRDGNTMTVPLPDHFGEQEDDDLTITLTGITIPNRHGNVDFFAWSENAKGSFKLLSPRPQAFVGNTMADYNTVSVVIKPEASYVGEEVDFDITLEAAGPMHDSEIRITMPLGIVDLQDDSAEPNYLEKRSGPSGSTVGVDLDEPDGNVILIKTATLNAGGQIKVRVENVTIDEDVSTDPATGFLVSTITRGTEETDTDENISLMGEFANILTDDSKRSIDGGLIRTVAGSGTMMVKPATVEQGSRIREITLTYTASTDLEKSVLEITAPDVIDTVLQGGKDSSSSGGGYVSALNALHLSRVVEVEDVERLAVADNTITWTALTLKKGEKFVTKIVRVELLEETGPATWEATLAGEAIPSDYNDPMVVVGTTKDDVVFEIVDEFGDSIPSPSYHAASEESIRFEFRTANTAIQSGGTLSFTVPRLWTLPSLTDIEGRARVGIVTPDPDDESKDILVPMLPADAATVDDREMVLTVSGRLVTLTIGEAGGLNAESNPVTIQYGTTGTTGFPVTISSSAVGDTDDEMDGLSIRGRFKVSSESGFGLRDAGAIRVDVINAKDSSGTATLSTRPSTVRAGSANNEITVVYTGAGTMDGGAVRLTIPEDWAAMQDDPLELNYVTVSASSGVVLTDDDTIMPFEIVDDGRAVEVNLTTFGARDKVTFTYGGGDGGHDKEGAVAQVNIGEATFMVESKGSSDGDFMEITDADSLMALTFEVKGAASGSGDGTAEIMSSNADEGLYDGETDADKTIKQVHAGDDSTYIVFTYTPVQTIAEGQLKFTVQGRWTPPQDDARHEPGYTFLEPMDGAQVIDEVFNEDTQSVTAGISLTLGQSIEIHYGAEDGGAEAPDSVPTGGYSSFAIAIKGTLDDDAEFEYIDDEDLAVMVRVQRSGGGMAEVSPMSVNAGDLMPEITVTYTADGQIDDGQLKLTIPANWDAPTSDNVTVKAMGSSAASVGDKMYGAGRATTALPEGLDAMDVIVDDVVLDGGDMVVFTYTSAMAQGTTDSANFAVAIDGGDGPGTGPMAVGGMTTVTVEEAGPGSGTATAMTDGIVLPGTEDNTLTFTYTVAGTASYPADIRVAVPDDWTPPLSSNYTVTHKRAGRTRPGIVEEKPPVDGAMLARVVDGEEVMAEDEIIFEFSNVTAPEDSDSYEFQVTFRGQAIAASPMVLVQDADASKLVIEAPDTIAGDVSGASVAITIKIQDADDGEAASADDVTVNLVTTNTSTGSFSLTDGGAAVKQAPISAGMSWVMVYYSDSRVGSTPTILISDDDSVLSSANTTIQVTTSRDTVETITVSSPMAKAGVVTITVTGTPGKTGTNAVFSVGKFVTNASLTESATSPGTYTGTVTVVSELQDGTHNVMATLGEANKTEVGALTIDTMMPSVTITAPAADMTVAKGESVTITATAGDGTGSGIASVMADVSMLDSTQTDVALTMGADGSYSVDVAISKKNTHANGSKTITVTAMDAAGNSSLMAEVMVMLDSMLSFTSMIPGGQTVLFHVPLDDDDVSTVGDLKEMLGDAVNLAIIWNAAESRWDSNTDDLVITADLGLILSMNAEATVTFEGDAWGNGVSVIELKAGRNIIGLPLKDASVTKVSDLLTALGVDSVTVSTNGGFVAVAAAGDPGGDDPVMGDAAYLVTSAADKTVPVLGSGWSDGDAASAAPIALAGYNVDNQTPVLDVRGSVVDEITGLAREGFRVKVKNLSTKAALSSVFSAEAADGYNMTFVDLTDAHAARVGDVLEISADSPNPLIGVQPVRHIVTVDDVKSNRIQLEELIAYEIPAETELLRNYPNPFNPETWIPYRLAQDADVSLTIYDTSGTLVRSIDIGHQTAAVYDTKAKAIYWDGRNRFGEQVASGLYFYHLSAGDDFSGTRRMVILK